jgi:hypothetical protein
MTMLSIALIAILLVNAIFWGTFGHKAHCRVAKAMGVACIRHTYHRIIGAVCAILAAIVAAKLYF